MKVKNLRNRPIRIGDVVINPNKIVKISDDVNVESLVSQGTIEVQGMKIKEKK